MGLRFNPFTGNFDFTGGGGGGASYIDGEVATYNDLPLDGTAALNSAWLVRGNSGIWPFNKPAGIYYRSATAGVSRDADYTYGGTLGDVFSDSVFLLYDEADTTRTGQFNLGNITSGQNRVLTWPNAAGTIALTSQLATGSTDNAILRADGTGGSTLQDSALVIDDATTSTEANVAVVNNHSETDSSLVLTPKGNGSFILGPKPDGTSVGGNARGIKAVDLVLDRASAGSVASGSYSVCAGRRNAASGIASVCLGGDTNSATTTGASSFGGNGNVAAQQYAATIGGRNARADRWNMLAHAAGQFASGGDAQHGWFVLRCKTTTDSAVEMFLDGSAQRLTVPSGKVIAMLVNITGVKSDGSVVAHYLRQYAIKNVGGTTSEVYGAVTVGTDNAASTSIALSANDTNDALKIEVTGIASETWRWVATVDAVEVAYGS